MSILNVKKDPELASIKSEQLERFIREYLVASAIDVDTSLLETDFSISAIKPDMSEDDIKTLYEQVTGMKPKDSDVKQYTSQLTQFEFDLSKKMRLIGIDAIYIPQNW